MADNINITKDKIFKLEPFNVNKNNFYLLVKNNHPRLLDSNKYELFRKTLMDSIQNLSNNTFWVVRAESNGEKEKNILENNIVTINWSAGDLSQFTDKESLKKEFSRLNPDRKKHSVEIISSELWKFAKEIKIGDIVILPQLAKGSNHNIAIAQVTDDYRYREDLLGIENTRPVIWLHKNILIINGHNFIN